VPSAQRASGSASPSGWFVVLHPSLAIVSTPVGLTARSGWLSQAQDLGLHRDEIKSTIEMSEHDRLEERAFLELKRRVWAGCVIMDRWYAASLGTPMLIDLLDCDVR
jgi:hypothetical protein